MSALRASFGTSTRFIVILSIIENRYKLPFASSPEPVKLRNNKSARLHAGFVDRVIYDDVNNFFFFYFL